jgi:hypothetical protein
MATPFVREFGLMTGMLDRYGPEDGVAKMIFVQKVSAVHDAIAAKISKVAQARRQKPENIITLEGDENG